MQLVINSWGAFLGKRENCFLIKKPAEDSGEERVFEVSAKKVESILISTSASLSTDAIQLAMENNTDIIFMDSFGNPYARVWHSKLGSTTLIRRRQLEIAETEEGFKLAQEWMVKKLESRIDFLKRLKNARPQKEEEIQGYIDGLVGIVAKLSLLQGTLDEKRATVMGLEGAGGKVYFDALNFTMPERFKFEGRSRNPAKDEFNCLLNYGYGVLYSLVEKACIIAGLDPYVGFIHTDNYNKKSLVFDLVEMFRVWVEETVAYLFSQRNVKKEFFNQIKNGLTLNQDGKTVLIESLNKFLERSVRYRGRNIKHRDIVQFECHRIANQLIKCEKSDVPDLDLDVKLTEMESPRLEQLEGE